MSRAPRSGGSDRPATPARRAAAMVSLVAAVGAAGGLVAVGVTHPVALAAGLVGMGMVTVGAWRAFLSGGRARLAALLVAGMGATLVAGAMAAIVARTTQHPGAVLATGALAGLAIGAARVALDHQIDDVRTDHGWRPVAASSRPALIINPRSGDGQADEADLADAARERGITVIYLEEGDDLAVLASTAVEDGADALGMAGGDGSLAVVADVAMAGGVPFVCVPAGTRNHLAADLGLDRSDPVAALDAFGAAIERTVDTATVNDRIFLNNVSLGVYGEMVQQPGYREDKVGTARELLGELAAEERAAYDLRLTGPDGDPIPSAYLVQVSVNRYLLDRWLDLGRRDRLDGGQLGVVVVRGDRPLVPSVLAAQAAARRLTADASVEEWGAPRLEVASDDPVVWAGVDGEAAALSPPLRFAVQPGALRIRVPSATAAVAERRRAREAGLRGLVHVARGGGSPR